VIKPGIIFTSQLRNYYKRFQIKLAGEKYEIYEISLIAAFVTVFLPLYFSLVAMGTSECGVMLGVW